MHFHSSDLYKTPSGFNKPELNKTRYLLFFHGSLTQPKPGSLFLRGQLKDWGLMFMKSNNLVETKLVLLAS
ncbi:hypothetical protein AALO_G00146730 [Alosa alosa]|uniref:Uncharacterized protein n=1 Tax=Alosa alosa TaxID=278164 RepID=A0AAV6GDY0_9TELE|nr:hypothetical protein AALO_G00146730 [Alosa alosa]